MQSLCAVAPAAARNVPAAHGVGLVVWTGQNRPAGQGKQSATLLALGLFLYVPAGQLIGALVAAGQSAQWGRQHNLLAWYHQWLP